MNMNCAACCTVILESEDYLRCSLNLCGQIFHLLCTGQNESNKTCTWVCPECKCLSKRGGDNTLTPVGATKKPRDPNITFRKKMTTVDDNVMQTSTVATVQSASRSVQHTTESELLSTEIHSLRQEMLLLRNEISKAVSLISSYEIKLENCTSKVEVLYSKLEISEMSYSAAAGSCQPQAAIALKHVGVASAEIKTMNTTLKSKQKKKTGRKVVQLEQLPHSTPQAVSRKQVQNEKVPTPVVPSPTSVESENQQPWVDVRRNRRRPPSMCGTAGPTTNPLKAVEPRNYIHLWNMESSADEIREYLRQLCPEGTCTVTELTPKGDYKSYKIAVPVAYYATCMSADVWPVNARIKAWIVYQNLSPSSQKPSQPFHGAPATQ